MAPNDRAQHSHDVLTVLVVGATGSIGRLVVEEVVPTRKSIWLPINHVPRVI